LSAFPGPTLLQCFQRLVVLTISVNQITNKLTLSVTAQIEVGCENMGANIKLLPILELCIVLLHNLSGLSDIDHLCILMHRSSPKPVPATTQGTVQGLLRVVKWLQVTLAIANHLTSSEILAVTNGFSETNLLSLKSISYSKKKFIITIANDCFRTKAKIAIQINLL